MEHKQQLELAQVLKLSPTLLQSMGILQMTTLELADYLQDLALENPVMEETPGGPGDRLGRLCQPGALAGPGRGLPPAGRRWGNLAGETGNRSPWRFSWRSSWTGQGLDQPLLAVCRYLVDLLDDHGRLDPEDLGGPDPGRGARGPAGGGGCRPAVPGPGGGGGSERRESLALQLKRQPGDHRVALAICEKGLDLLAREQYGALARRLGVPRKQVEAAAQAIRALDPNPVGAWAVQGEIEYLRPDAWVAGDRRDLAGLCEPMGPAPVPPQPGLPADGPGGPGGEAADYLRQKIQQARWVLQCVRRRQETLTRCLTALVAAQEDFSGGGPRCRGLCWGGSWRRPWACIPLR